MYKLWRVYTLFDNGGQIKYSFVLMLISLISLAAMGTIQKNISTKVRQVGLIDIIQRDNNMCRHL